MGEGGWGERGRGVIDYASREVKEPFQTSRLIKDQKDFYPKQCLTLLRTGAKALPFS